MWLINDVGIISLGSLMHDAREEKKKVMCPNVNPILIVTLQNSNKTLGLWGM